MSEQVKQWVGVMLVGLALVAGSRANAGDIDVSLQKAQQAYDQGQFQVAIDAYETAIAGGLRNGHLYYNLGHAYYKAGQTGQAMAAFLGARRLLPRNPDVKANIEFLQQKIADRLEIERPPSLASTLLFWTKLFTPLELWRASTILLALLCFGYGYVVLKRISGGLRQGLVAVFILPILIAVSAVVATMTQDQWGAVTGKEAVVYSGPAEKNTVLFQLSEGAPFIFRRTSGEWLQIALTDGKKGWVKNEVAQVY